MALPLPSIQAPMRPNTSSYAPNAGQNLTKALGGAPNGTITALLGQIRDTITLNSQKIDRLTDIEEDIFEQLKLMTVADEEILDYQRKHHDMARGAAEIPFSFLSPDRDDKPKKKENEIEDTLKDMLKDALAPVILAIMGVDKIVGSVYNWITGSDFNKDILDSLKDLKDSIVGAVDDLHHITNPTPNPSGHSDPGEGPNTDRTEHAGSLGGKIGGWLGDAEEGGPLGLAAEAVGGTVGATEAIIEHPLGEYGKPSEGLAGFNKGAEAAGKWTEKAGEIIGTGLGRKAAGGDFYPPKATITAAPPSDGNFIDNFITDVLANPKFGEGKEGKPILHRYGPDRNGIFDIGWGHQIVTAEEKKKYGPDVTITVDEAKRLARIDIAEKEKMAHDALTDKYWQRLPSGAREAFVDLYYSGTARRDIITKTQELLDKNGSKPLAKDDATRYAIADLFKISKSDPEYAGWGGVPERAAARQLLAARPFKEGGLVTEPTLAVLGEAGPELVVPLSPKLAPTNIIGSKGMALNKSSSEASINAGKSRTIVLPASSGGSTKVHHTPASTIVGGASVRSSAPYSHHRILATV